MSDMYYILVKLEVSVQTPHKILLKKSKYTSEILKPGQLSSCMRLYLFNGKVVSSVAVN